MIDGKLAAASIWVHRNSLVTVTALGGIVGRVTQLEVDSRRVTVDLGPQGTWHGLVDLVEAVEPPLPPCHSAVKAALDANPEPRWLNLLSSPESLAAKGTAAVLRWAAREYTALSTGETALKFAQWLDEQANEVDASVAS